MPALDDQTKSRVRYHLRFPQIESGAYIEMQGVVLATVAATNKLEYAMDNVRSGTEATILRLLGILDSIEEKMSSGALCRLQMSSVDEIDTNPEELTELEKQYIRWARSLADVFSVSFYPQSYMAKIADKNIGSTKRVST